MIFFILRHLIYTSPIEYTRKYFFIYVEYIQNILLLQWNAWITVWEHHASPMIVVFKLSPFANTLVDIVYGHELKQNNIPKCFVDVKTDSGPYVNSSQANR